MSASIVLLCLVHSYRPQINPLNNFLSGLYYRTFIERETETLAISSPVASITGIRGHVHVKSELLPFFILLNHLALPVTSLLLNIHVKLCTVFMGHKYVRPSSSVSFFMTFIGHLYALFYAARYVWKTLCLQHVTCFQRADRLLEKTDTYEIRRKPRGE